MRPLLFVNWRSVNALFCGLMWLVVLVLLVVIVAHSAALGALIHHAARPAR